MTEPELKPCPFCGKTPLIRIIKLHCDNLKCPIHYIHFTFEQWNTRHETPLQAAAPDLLSVLQQWSDGTNSDSIPNCFKGLDDAIAARDEVIAKFRTIEGSQP